ELDCRVVSQRAPGLKDLCVIGTLGLPRFHLAKSPLSAAALLQRNLAVLRRAQQRKSRLDRVGGFDQDICLAWGRNIMADDSATGAEFTIGSVLRRSIGVITDNPVTVFGIAFLLGGLPSLF